VRIENIIGLYRNLSLRQRLYLKARYLISPVKTIEEAVPQSGRIYDVGCGAGLLSNIIASESSARRVTGMDLSGEKIAIARKSLNGRDNIEFEIGDALNFRFDKPDAFVMSDMLHHMPFGMQEELLRRIYGSLNKGGVLVMQDIDITPLYKYIFALSVDKVLNSMASVYYRRSSDWRDVIKAIGFVVESEKIGKGYPIAAVIYRCVK